MILDVDRAECSRLAVGLSKELRTSLALWPVAATDRNVHLLAESFGRSACPFHHDRRGSRSGRKADADAAARTAVAVSRA